MTHNSSLAIAFSLVALVCLTSPGPHTATVVQAKNESPWISFAPVDEELALRLPAAPTKRVYPISRPYDTSRERVLAHNEYGGYGEGMIFIIHSFKAAKPQRLSGGMVNFISEDGDFERDVSFDGITTKLYRGNEERRLATYTRRNLRFLTREHLYVVFVMTLEENNPAVDRFFSSLRLRKSSDAGNQELASSENVTGETLSNKQVTRPFIIVWKSEPWYTDAARAHRVVGTVVIEAVLSANGYVTNITVTKGLDDGLTESAIDAARDIRFFPAQKDGKPVSQRTQLEYNFNLY